MLDPLALILPMADDRAAWLRSATTTAADTRSQVVAYEHHATGRRLHLDGAGRVYGQDAEGAVRLFGRGGAMALAVALNAIFDGHDRLRPTRVALPSAESASHR